jgi:Cytochrome c554 and c-prime
MTRTSWRPVAALGLVAALFGYVGCSSSRDKNTTGTAASGPEPAPSASAAQEPKRAPAASVVKPPFDGWPEPAGALLISGEQLGYLEPCGCTEGQHGGLLRRYDLVERIRTERKWPLVLVDLGSLIKDPAAARGGPEQAKIKFQFALQALATLNYEALALSPEDLKVGVQEALGQFLNMPGERTKVVVANVAAAGFEARIVPSLRARAGPITVGITAVIDPETLKALKDPTLDLLAIQPIDQTLPAVLVDLEKDTKTQVLLVQAPPEEAKRLAEKFPGFEIVVGTSATADPPSEPQRLNGGKTLLVTVGQRGKYVGVVGLYPDEKEPCRYQLVSLGTRYNGPAKPMKTVIEDEFRKALEDQRVVENFPRHDYVDGAPGATFVGAENCKFCHMNTFNKWMTTKHSQAYVALEHDPKPNVIYDADCVTCHTTGFEYNSGWKSPAATPYLKGNQCENCHGPASKHCEEPDNKDYRAPMHLTAEQADKNRLCLRCHDEDNSPHFDFPKYYPQILHKGFDDYTDLRFHQPRPAKRAGADAK